MDDNAAYMLAIHETGSITKAAEKMHISQPALSQRLVKVENRLGCQLFERQSKPMRPTQAGQVYLSWAKDALSSEVNMTNRIKDMATGSIRHIHVGTSIPRGSCILPEVIATFQKDNPQCIVHIHEAGKPDNHNALLLNETIGFSIFTPVHAEQTIFVGDVICYERMQYIAPKQWNLEGVSGKGRPTVDPESIGSRPFIMPPEHLKHASVVKSILDECSAEPPIVAHSCSNEMTIRLIRQGVGASISPNTFVLEDGDETVSRYEISGVDAHNPIYCNYRKGHRFSKDEIEFLQIAKEWVAAHHLSLHSVDAC